MTNGNDRIGFRATGGDIRVLTVCILLGVAGGCARQPSSPTNRSMVAPVSAIKEIAPKAAVIEYGVYDEVRPGFLVDSPNTSTGKMIKRPVLKLAERTNRVRIEKDLFFGYRYRVFNVPTDLRQIELKRVLTHPEMVRPDGSTTTGSTATFRQRVQSGSIVAMDAYAFSEEFEMVEGDWSFQLWYDDTLLLEQRFDVYRAAPGSGYLGSE